MSVHLVHGDKGGVGKSLLASVLVEYVLARKCDAFVVDADMRNADLFAAFQHTDVPTARVDVRTQDGWMELATILERTQDAEVVISLPAGVGSEVAENERFLREALEGLERSLVCFSVFNRSPHSIALLRPFLERYGDFARAMVAVRNLYFGGPSASRAGGTPKRARRSRPPAAWRWTSRTSATASWTPRSCTCRPGASATAPR